MPSCPNCNVNLPPDFGLVVCSSCGASVFINEFGEAVNNELSDSDYQLEPENEHSAGQINRSQVSPNQTVSQYLADDLLSQISEPSFGGAPFDEVGQEDLRLDEHEAIREDESLIADPSNQKWRESVESDDFKIYDEEEPNPSIEQQNFSSDTQVLDPSENNIEKVPSISVRENESIVPTFQEKERQQILLSAQFVDRGEKEAPEATLRQKIKTKFFSQVKKFKEKSDDLSEIADYGNSLVSNALEGPILYDIYIAGIDTKDLRKALMEELVDTKLGITIEDLSEGIQDGCLILKGLSGVKSSVIVNRLIPYSFEMQWRQYAVQDSDI